MTNGTKLFYDFHGEPKDDKTGYFKSFKKSTQDKSSGTLTTSFEGTHGWYWKNNTSSAVDIILKVNGEYQRLDLLKKQTNFDIQLFGDRINIVLDNYETDFHVVQKVFDQHSINLIDKRLVTPSLENVFIHLIKEAG